MLCFNCGNPLSSSEYCSNCGIKVTVYKKIIRMSNTYYNMGLVKANNRDLSGAADMLRRSLRLDKGNTRARNLLGLVYFEMGETVQAISEWVISQNLKPEKNPANGYIKSVQSNANKLAELNQNIKKFNIALKYAKMGNDDVATIQLKKVLNQNPNFVKGHQLLALLLMKNDDYDRARKVIKKALEIDRCNPLSLKYSQEIELVILSNKKNPDKKPSKNSAIDRPYLSGNDVVIPPHSFREPSSGAITILNVLIGLIIGALAMYFVVTPVKVKNEVSKNNEIVLDYTQKLAIKNSTLADLEKQVKALEKDKKNLQKTIDKSSNKENDTIKNYDNLLKALDALRQEDKETGALALKEVNKDLEIDSEVYNNVLAFLNNELAGYLAKNLFEKGVSAATIGNYSEAIKNFEDCLKEEPTYAEALYRMGLAYEKLGDTDKAVEKFNEVMTKFANTQYYQMAKARIPKE